MNPLPALNFAALTMPSRPMNNSSTTPMGHWFRSRSSDLMITTLSLSGLEGLCLLLKRLAYPCRYFDLISTFGRPVPELCMIANTVLDWVFNEHGFRLTSWNQPFLTPACLQEYACAIARQGSPLTNCFGFIDGTVCPICRPGEKQRVVYTTEFKGRQ